MPRQRWLIGFLAVTLALVAWTAVRGNSNSASLVEPSAPRGARKSPADAPVPPAATTPATTLDEQGRDPIAESAADPFAPVSFLPPAPKVVATVTPPLPPPKPIAPPFPFRYFGKMANVDGKLIIYLTRDDVLIPINEKQILDNAYRIDSVTDTQILITYLPLNEQSAITIQSAAE